MTLEFTDSHAHSTAPSSTPTAARSWPGRGPPGSGASSSSARSATSPAPSARVDLAVADPDVFAVIGTHPHDAEQLTDAWWGDHERLARHPRVVAIGETGLDYHYDHSPRAAQADAFRRFVALARAVDKPIVCHIRDAHAEARAILADTGAAAVGGIIHCFTGDADDAAAYVELGFHVSFSGIVTYKTRSRSATRSAGSRSIAS